MRFERVIVCYIDIVMHLVHLCLLAYFGACYVIVTDLKDLSANKWKCKLRAALSNPRTTSMIPVNDLYFDTKNNGCSLYYILSH